MALCFLFSALIVALDQIFKQWILRTIPINEFGPDIIPGVLGLMHYENDGAMLNILSGQQWLLAGIAFIASVVLIMILLRYDEGFWGTLGLASVLGGTIGNLCDRIFNDGKVIDMFRTLFIQFPIFNFADVFITLGFFTFLAHFISLTIKSGKSAPATNQRTRTARSSSVEEEIETDDIAQLGDILPAAAMKEIANYDEPAVYDTDQQAAADISYAQTAAMPEYTDEPVEYTEVYAQEETYVPVPDTAAVTSYAQADDSIDYSFDGLGIDLDELNVDYDVDDLLREYGIDDDDINL